MAFNGSPDPIMCAVKSWLRPYPGPSASSKFCRSLSSRSKTTPSSKFPAALWIVALPDPSILRFEKVSAQSLTLACPRILAEIDDTGLDLEFLEQVFIRRMSAYKALLLQAPNPTTGFWTGATTDRQAGGAAENISQYWMIDFLAADFAETPAAGTLRLAEALKRAIKANPSLGVKGEIGSAVTLAKNALSGKQTSVTDFCNHFGFSLSTQQSVIAQL